MKTIVLAGGGTAGHITPHLALLPYLNNYFDKVCYIGSGKEIEKNLMQNKRVEIFNVDPPAFVRSLSPKNLLIPFKLATAVKRCEEYLKRTKPSVVFSKGGYCALPVCLACFKLNIPVVCHESDLTLGLANKLTYKRANKLLTTFEETAVKYNGTFVGPPLRAEFHLKNKEIAKRNVGIKDNRPVLLITGGSQGSKTINMAVEANLEKLLLYFNVIHLHGKKYKPPYKAINGYFPFAFADMPALLSACDVCISRGGSNTLFELLCAKIPSLIIPLKKGSRGDQIKNAEYFYKKGAILTADEDLLEKDILALTKDLYSRRLVLKKNIENLKLSSGTQKIADLLKTF